ncbi:unnamed protein product [Cuscuta europaea]|uniref:BHLH domain-containing protein n=1 Tax=Cuscuta europaea TaxID=41803 RepID=A0A9P0YZI1_CUSEU|nr:unnamed protein product [Cuscuta europaea]
MDEENIMELLWQNGQVVMHTQNQRSYHKPIFSSDAAIPAEQPVGRQIRLPGEETSAANQHLFMEEDEMASWLDYPLDEPSFDDRDLYCSDLLYPPAATTFAPPVSSVPTREIRSPAAEIRQARIHQPPTQTPRVPLAKPPEARGAPRVQNFSHFSRLHRGRIEPVPLSSSKAPIESTIVDSSETPHVAESVTPVSGGKLSGTVDTGSSPRGKRDEKVSCEQTVTSSPGDSGASGSAEPPQNAAVDDRKRKGREADETEGHSEDMDLESVDTKKDKRGCPSTKRSRAAQVHNLSERRRRDRINEKMRALQELIPRCNKSDKASMLDDAIEYLKSLQVQVQMMSMGCGMVPMMYPASMQQYMQTKMGMNMMGMCMDMGMSRPPMVPPYSVPPPPTHLPGSSMLPNPTTAAQMNTPRFPIPPPSFPFPVKPDPSRLPTSGSILTPLVSLNPNQQQIPNFVDPYQQFLGVHQAQVTLPLNQTVERHINNKPSSSKDLGSSGSHQSCAP